MDAVERSKRLQFVVEQLQSYTGPKKSHDSYTFIQCPVHNEKTPSLRIFHYPDSKSPGYSKCYGCGHQSNWDDMAPKLGLQPYKRGKPKDEFASLSLNSLQRSITKDDLTFKQEKMKFQDLTPGQTWRHIKTDLLIQVGAKLCRVYNEDGRYWSNPLLYLPCFVNNKLAGYIKAQLEKSEGSISYINASGPWSKTRGLFPYDRALKLMRRKKSTCMVLVEGPRDALRLIQMGIPAMCILGTQSWSDEKSIMLELGGITRILLMMDGDEAGIKATEMLTPKLEKMFRVKIIKLWNMRQSPYRLVRNEDNIKKAAAKLGLSFWDPASVDRSILNKIKDKYYS